MSFGAAGSAAQLGNDLINQSVGYAISAKSASDDWDRYKNSITRGFQYKMEGLSNAGLNPILAAAGGLGAGAPSLPKTGPTRTGGSVDNPAVAASTVAAQRASAAASTSSAQLLEDQAAGVRYENIYKAGLAGFWESPEGVRAIRQGAINSALPQTAPGIAANLTWQAGNAAMDATDAKSLKPRTRKPNFKVPPGTHERHQRKTGFDRSNSPHILPRDARPGGPQ